MAHHVAVDPGTGGRGEVVGSIRQAAQREEEKDDGCDHERASHLDDEPAAGRAPYIGQASPENPVAVGQEKEHEQGSGLKPVSEVLFDAQPLDEERYQSEADCSADTADDREPNTLVGQ